MRCLFFVLLLLSTAFSEKCDLLELCKEKGELKCWPKSKDEFETFANQFKGFDNLKCLGDVLLNETLFSEISLGKRIQDLSNSGGFKNMADTLVEGLCSSEEMFEPLKMIPVATLYYSFSKQKNFNCLIKLMAHQGYYYLEKSFKLDGFGESLVNFLKKDIENKGLFWLKSPIWIVFAETQHVKDTQKKETLELFFRIGKEVGKKDTKDEIKAAFILTVTSFIKLFVFSNSSFFENDKRGQRTLGLLEKIIKSVIDDELRSVLELFPYSYKNGLEELRADAYKRQGYYSIKILWKHLKSIGHKHNAASLIFYNFYHCTFKFRYISWNASRDDDGQEMFAAFLSIASNTFALYDAKDVVDLTKSRTMSTKFKEHECLFGKRLHLKDFNYMIYNNPNRNVGTETRPATVQSLATQSPKELDAFLYSHHDGKIYELLLLLSQFPAFSKNVRDWSRSYPVSSALTKRLLSFKPSPYMPIPQYDFIVYFLLPSVPFNQLELFDNDKGSLALSFLFSSDLLETRVQTLEWLFSVRKAVPVLFKPATRITAGHVDLIWTYRMILSEFVEELKLTTDDKNTKGTEKDSYILGMFLQDFGPHAGIFDRKDLEKMPLKWTLSAKALKIATGTVILDSVTSALNNSHEKIPLSSVVKALARHLDDESKWERITDYLKSTNLDFMTVEELTDELLNGISKKANWNTNQKLFVHDLFACYRLDTDERPKRRKELVSAFRLNSQVLPYLVSFVSFSFATWMPSPYESIKKFHSTITRKNRGNSKLQFKSKVYLPSFENALHENPEILAQSNSDIGYLDDFSIQQIQTFLKGLLDEQFKFFKETKTGFYIPAWAVSKETGKTIGMLLGKYIQISIPFAVPLDPTFLSLLLDSNKEKIKKYYKVHYAEDFNNYAKLIKSQSEKGFDKLPVPEVCHVKCTDKRSISNLFSPDPGSQMKTTPSWDYLTTSYLESIEYIMEQAFYDMVLEMLKGLFIFLNKEIWGKIHSVEHLEDLLKGGKR